MTTQRQKTPPWLVILVVLGLTVYKVLTHTPDTTPASAPSSETTASENAPPKERARVLHVFDGDTIEVSIKGRRAKVRMIGIDAMDSHHQGKAVRQAREYGVSVEQIKKKSRAASAFAKRTLDGQTVDLLADAASGDTDPYDRILRYVEVGGKDFGELILREGLAEPRRESHQRRSHYHRIAKPIRFP